MSQYLVQECFDLNSSIALQERLPAQKLTSFESSDDASLTRRSVFAISGSFNLKRNPEYQAA